MRCVSFINANVVWAKFVLFGTSEGSGPIYRKTLISLLWRAAFLQLNRMRERRLIDARYFGLLAECTCIRAWDRHNKRCPLKWSGEKCQKGKRICLPVRYGFLTEWILERFHILLFVDGWQTWKSIFFPKTICSITRLLKFKWQVTGCSNTKRILCSDDCCKSRTDRICLNSYIMKQNPYVI